MISLWRGPEEDGVSFNLLSRFLCDRERFWLYAIQGLRPVKTFNHRIEYGQFWHACEAARLRGASWEDALQRMTNKLCQQYPTQQDQVQFWAAICSITYKVMLDYLERMPLLDVQISLLQEKVFDVRYFLDKKRFVRLRGRWDSVNWLGNERGGIYLQENKTKGTIYEELIRKQVSSGFDLQTTLYLTALSICLKQKEFQEQWIWPKLKHTPHLRHIPLNGVLYHVIRRPLSGGKGMIYRHKDEPLPDFCQRLEKVIASQPEEFFKFWRIEIQKADLLKFEKQCLRPILTQLYNWWLVMQKCEKPEDRWLFPDQHFQMPYGIYNVLLEGGVGELDDYLVRGSKVGLTRVNNLFEELEDNEVNEPEIDDIPF